MNSETSTERRPNLEVKVVIGDCTKVEVDALIVNLFEGVVQPGGATGAVDKALDGAISQLIAAGEIKGKTGELTLVHSLGKIPAKRVVVAGLGKQAQFNVDSIRRVSAEACRFARSKAARKVATILHGGGVGGIEPEKAAQAITEGASTGSASTSPRNRRTVICRSFSSSRETRPSGANWRRAATSAR
jgi:leucyl aminopeptidase